MDASHPVGNFSQDLENDHEKNRVARVTTRIHSLKNGVAVKLGPQAGCLCRQIMPAKTYESCLPSNTFARPW